MKKIIITSIFAAFTIVGLAFFYAFQSPATSAPISKNATSVLSEKKYAPHLALDSPSPVPPNPPNKPTPPSPAPPATANQPAFEVSTIGPAIRTSDIVVPAGVQVPAVLMDGGGPDDSAETQDIMNGIVEEFADKIQEAKRTNRNMEEAWEEAREEANDRYRQFFGFEALNAATIESAGEAYEESNSTLAPAAR
jgi:hypothetical protein